MIEIFSRYTSVPTGDQHIQLLLDRLNLKDRAVEVPVAPTGLRTLCALA